MQSNKTYGASKMKRRCPTCQENKDKSVVQSHGAIRTLMYSIHYWDEDGFEHYHDPNFVTSSYSCSKGHLWSDKKKAQCPVKDCDWNK